ncbi:MAG TPA: acyl carrier protein [Pirellulales bacterium]|nr:acyl carrier protein [Pirellulales bacterium]
MDNIENVRAKVNATIQHVLEGTSRPRRPFEDDDLLFAEVGLDSLDLAQVVVILEQELGVDPFRQCGTHIRTFSDLVRGYQAALEKRA